MGKIGRIRIISITAALLGASLTILGASCSHHECDYGKPCSDDQYCWVTMDPVTCGGVFTCLDLGECAGARDLCDCIWTKLQPGDGEECQGYKGGGVLAAEYNYDSPNCP